MSRTILGYMLRRTENNSTCIDACNTCIINHCGRSKAVTGDVNAMLRSTCTTREGPIRNEVYRARDRVEVYEATSAPWSALIDKDHPHKQNMKVCKFNLKFR